MDSAMREQREPTGGVLLDELSREFAGVVRRIQGHWSRAPVANVAKGVEALVEAAERNVDRSGSELVCGRAQRSQWRKALLSYEQAWAKVFESLGERRN